MVCSGQPNLNACGQPFPSDYCCPSSATCLPVYITDNATLPDATICCPKSSDCSIIQTITCDVTQLNAALHPENQMHAEGTVALEICGDKCCPPGYACKSGMCFINNEAKRPKTSTSAPTGSTSVSSVESTATAVTTLTPVSSPLSSPPSSGRGNVMVIALASALGGAFIFSLIIGIFLIRRYGLPFKRSRSGGSRHKEKKISWNKPELEDTQKRAVYAELGTASNAHELRASRDASELPG